MSTNLSHPVWTDLGSQDAAGSRAFYAELLGWVVEPDPDPQFGGYAVAQKDGKDVAGIGPAQSPDQPTAWSLYFGSDDLADLASRIEGAGGTVAVPAFPVGPMGSMAVYQDPTGAFFSAWQAGLMPGFAATGDGTFAWAELNARGLDRAVAFYTGVFGWQQESMDMPGIGRYVILLDGETQLAGAMEVPPMVPAEVPGYWLVYFQADDIDATVATASRLGSQVLVPVTDMGAGRFAILTDPQGAAFGLFSR